MSSIEQLAKFHLVPTLTINKNAPYSLDCCIFFCSFSFTLYPSVALHLLLLRKAFKSHWLTAHSSNMKGITGNEKNTEEAIRYICRVCVNVENCCMNRCYCCRRWMHCRQAPINRTRAGEFIVSVHGNRKKRQRQNDASVSHWKIGLHSCECEHTLFTFLIFVSRSLYLILYVSTVCLHII